MERDTVEQLLDEGRIEGAMSNGRWWRIRRNGQTKTWKTRPGEFRIPIKAGFRVYHYLDHTNYKNTRMFRVTPS